ncbi:unnamed protein product [Colias eurytheme]|nr:unnamed protein product [Colias eurytheme]
MDNRDEQARDAPGDPGPSGSGIDTSKRTRIINNGSSSSHSTSSSDNDSRMSPPQRKRQKKSLRSPLQCKYQFYRNLSNILVTVYNQQVC